MNSRRWCKLRIFEAAKVKDSHPMLTKFDDTWPTFLRAAKVNNSQPTIMHIEDF